MFHNRDHLCTHLLQNTQISIDNKEHIISIILILTTMINTYYESSESRNDYQSTDYHRYDYDYQHNDFRIDFSNQIPKYCDFF